MTLLAIIVIVFIASLLFGYYGGRHLLPFACWCLSVNSGYETSVYIALGIFVLCFFIHIFFIRNKKNGFRNTLLIWIVIIIGVGIGGLRMKDYLYSGMDFKDRNYSSFSTNHGYTIGLYNKWGVRVVPDVCDGIFLYKDEISGDDAFIGYFLNKDSIKFYQYIDKQGIYRKSTPLTTMDDFIKYRKAEFTTIICIYQNPGFSKKFDKFVKDKNETHNNGVSGRSKEGPQTERRESAPSQNPVSHSNPNPEPAPRQLVPVQEWVECGICRGSRNCQACGGAGWVYSASSPTGRTDCYNCNGRKDCTACGGRGGQYRTVYR